VTQPVTTGRTPPDRVALIVGLVLLAGALGMLGGSAYSYRQQSAFVEAGQRATGLVVDNAWLDNRMQGGDETPGGWAPVVRYEHTSGSPTTFTSGVSSYPDPRYTVGDEVDVLFDADDPAGAEIADFWTLWLVPLVLSGIGAVMALFGGILTGSEASSR